MHRALGVTLRSSRFGPTTMSRKLYSNSANTREASQDREFYPLAEPTQAMVSGSFLERLEAAAMGRVSRESVLEPFLDGLDQLWCDFEAAWEQQPDELADFLEAYVAAIEDGLEACEQLARECLSSETTEETFLDLGDAHTHLNRLLLDFHSQSWIFRGPTKVDWINMVVDGGERFLAGESFPRYLITLLDDHVRELEFKLSCRPALEGEALLKVTRQFASWSKGHEQMSRHQFEDLLTKLIGYAERFADYLMEQTVSLEQLLASLGGDVPNEEIVWLLDGVLTELRRIRADFESAVKATGQSPGKEAGRLLDTLSELETAVGTLAEQGDGHLEDEDIDDLHELHELLEQEIAAFGRAAATEGTVACASCGHRNSRRAARCGSCSCLLAADLSASVSSMDFGELERSEGGEENVYRLRRACSEFQNLALSLEDFHGTVHQTRGIFEGAARGFLQSARAPANPTETLFRDSVESIGRSLDLLAAIEHPEDRQIEEALVIFEDGVTKMRQARDLVK